MSRLFVERYASYRKRVERELARWSKARAPHTLYGPAGYVLAAGGKRVRSVLVLAACRAVGGRPERALPAAAAIEILHNFTLVHDDIMDHARSRRGRETVHVRWDSNVALLTGDAMVAMAYGALLESRVSDVRPLVELFTDGLRVVCDGQAFDKEYETRRRVSVREYLSMIEQKTGRLISVASELGAVIGGATKRQRRALRTYGALLGRAFQVRDDLLDITADEAEFGKRIGGDLVEGKRTYLLLKALERARGADRRELLRVLRHDGVRFSQVSRFREIFDRTGALAAAETQIARDIRAAQRSLRVLSPTEDRAMLHWFAELLRTRTS